MPGVCAFRKKYLAREIGRIANAGIRSVMTLVFPHHTDATAAIPGMKMVCGAYVADL